MSEKTRCHHCKRKTMVTRTAFGKSSEILGHECEVCGRRRCTGNAYVKGWPDAQKWMKGEKIK